MLVALGFIGANVMLEGVASFLEQPLSRKLDAFRLGAALRLGGLVVAVVALLAGRGPAIPALEPGLAGVGIGLILGIGSAFYCLALSRLAPWLAASVANGYVAVTILLGVVVVLALAAVIFGNWRPFGAAAACLLFGFSSALAQRLPEYSQSASVLFQALPYVLTLIAVAGGTIGLVETGDQIRIDVATRTLEVLVSDEELATRRAKMEASEKPWQPVDRQRTVTTALRAYAALSTSEAQAGQCVGRVIGRASAGRASRSNVRMYTP